MSSSFVDVKRDEMFQRLICLFWWKHGGLVASVEKHVPMLYTLEQPPSDADCTEGSGDGRPPTTDHHLCPQTSSSAPWIRIRTIQIRPQTKSGDTTSSISFRGETIIVLLFLNRFMRSRVSLNSFWKSTDDDQTLKLGDSRRFDPQSSSSFIGLSSGWFRGRIFCRFSSNFLWHGLIRLCDGFFSPAASWTVFKSSSCWSADPRRPLLAVVNRGPPARLHGTCSDIDYDIRTNY